MKNLISKTKKNLWQTGRNHDGFTLVEVLVSMVILSFGILGLVKTADLVIFCRNNSGLVTEATLLTTNKIEEIKRLVAEEPTGGAFGFNYLTTTYVEDTAVWAEISNANYQRVETEGDFQVTTDLKVYPSGSTDSFEEPLSIHMLEVVVKTEWTSSRGNSEEMASVLRNRG